MRAKACCACRVSRLTMNLNYSARRTSWNTIRQQMLSDFVLFHSVEPIGEPAVLMSVLSLLSRARGANYSLRNPVCVALGLGAAQPTQMFVGMKPCDCAVSALWPTECAFKEDSQTVGISPGTLVWWHHVAVYLLWSAQRCTVGYDIRYETLQLIRAAFLCIKKNNNWWHVSRRSWVPSRPVLVTVAMTSVCLFAKCRQRLHSGGTMTQQEVEATWAPENSSSGRNAWTWRARTTKDGTSAIKTVWARSCQVRLSTPLFQQTWQTP